MSDRFEQLRMVYRSSYDRAPGCRAIFDAAGIKPEDLRSIHDLSRLPVFQKEALLERQIADPPFGGLLAGDIEDISHFYVSPGPIIEPYFRGEGGGNGFDLVFRAAAIGPGDIVLNTWNYHLVPAGLLLDHALQSVGATVVPGGVGNTELQAQLVLRLGVTCICASTAFFATLVEMIEKTGHVLPRDWNVRSAFLGGEFKDWMSTRRRFEERYGIKIFSAYGTADFGLIGFENGLDEGYEIHPKRIVQICEPASGAPVVPGQDGEIVVTTLEPGWPLIRFGTGDLSHALEMAPDGSVKRIGLLQGRVGHAAKVREIFVYPYHIRQIECRIPEVARAQAVVVRIGNRDEITLRVALTKKAPIDEIEVRVRAAFNELTRLRADRVTIVGVDEIDLNAPLIHESSNP